MKHRPTRPAPPRALHVSSRSAGSRHWRPRQLVLALAVAGIASHALLAPGRAQAQAKPAAQVLPSGLNVAQGQAAVNVNGGQMTVTNSAGAVLQWQSFSIGSSSGVRFEQPTSSSRVLNQVVGSNPSSIFGSLTSNGEVWLVNPFGVLFGRDARVDVASLVVSTLNISGDDWRRGRFSLSAAGSDAGASVVNQGALRTTTGGRVLLLAADGGVRNEGLIAAPDGQVVLAAGRSIDLADADTRNVAVRVSAPAGEARNLGQVVAGTGRVDLWAAMVNQQGLVQADAIGGTGRGGEVVLRASEAVQAAAGSVTSANGAAGGAVTVDAGTGTASVVGAVTATGGSGQGGDITLLGARVGVLDGAVVDASGASGGGTVRVGGGRQGQDASVPNAQAVFFGAGASIAADATAQGSGGSVVLWADAATRAYGHLSARGGPLGGHGGFIETSGGWLDAQPASVRTSAPLGRSGVWLLDPNNIFIVDGGANSNVGAAPNFSTTGDSAVLTTGAISAALNAGNNVTVTTASLGANTQAGDIVMFSGTITANVSAPVSLTMNAARNISLQSSTITSTFAPLSLTLNAAGSGQGTVQIDNSTITTLGGNVLLTGPAAPTGPHGASPFTGAVGYNNNGVGVSISRSVIAADTGSITANGISLATSGVSGLAQGVSVSAGSQLTARVINLRGRVDSNGDLDRSGVVVETGTRVEATGSLSLRGTALSDSSSTRGLDGVRIAGNVLVNNVSPSPGSLLNIEGVVDGAYPGGGTNFGNGINLTGTASLDASGAESASLLGTRDIRLGAYNGGNLVNFIASTGGATTIVNSDAAAGRVVFDEVFISGSPSSLLVDAHAITGYHQTALSGSAGITFSADTYSAPFFSRLSAPGPIAIRADVIDLDVGVSIQSDAPGDAITVSGRGTGTSTTHFVSNAGTGALVTSNGRWLIYGTDPTDTANFNLGGLEYDATVYGAVPGQAFDAGANTTTGRLQLFSLLPSLSAGAGSGIARDYDGSLDIDVTFSGQVSGLVNGDRLIGLFDDANAGTGKTITLFPSSAAPTILDQLGKPVYGYDVPNAFALTGDVTPRPVTLTGVAAASKVYDGSTLAAVSGGALNNLAGGETLTVTLDAGQFDTKNVGAGKTVTGSASIADGSGLASNYSLGGGYTTAADITPRSVSASGVLAANKTYDGSTAASLSGGALSNLVGAETLALVLSGGAFNTKDAGTGKPVTGTAALADGGNGGLAGNYVLGSTSVSSTADVLRKAITVSGVSAAGKVYDGSRAAAVAGGSVAGLVGSESLVVAPTGLFDTKDAGTNKTVAGTVALSDGSGLVANYVLASNAFTTTASVQPRTVTASGFVFGNKTYDGTATAAVSGGSLSGLVGAETLALSASGSFADKNAGSGKTVSATSALANGSNGGLASNYVLASNSVLGSADILRRTVAVAGLTAASKAYDGTRAAAVSGGTVSGLVGAETLALTLGAALFDTKDAGTGKAVTGSAALADGSGGGLATNYSLAGGGFATTADITPRSVTLGAVTAADKVYDGTRAASIAGGTVNNLVGGETLTFNLSGALFDTKDAATGKTVTGSAVLADGAGGGLASNYNLASGAFTTTASVQRRTVTASGVTALSKTYDGTRTATVGGGVLANLVGAETLGLALSGGLFDSADAGAAKAVTGSASLSDGSNGGLAANYALASATVNTTADVLRRTLSVSGVTAASKAYDGSRSATVAGGTLAGLVAGETLGVAGIGLFDTKDAGSGKAVAGTVTLADGTGRASNYNLAGNAFTATADITPRTLSLAGVAAADKTYDGTTQVVLGGGVLGGLVGPETLALTLAGALVDRNAGQGKAVVGTAGLADGSNGGLAANYALAAPAFATSANVAPRGLAVTAATVAGKTYDGTTAATVTGWTLGGAVAGDRVAVAAGNAVFSSPGAGTARPATATATALGGADAGNYSLGQASVATAAAILPATLNYLATPAVGRVGEPLVALGGTLTGFVAGETVAIATTGTLLFSSAATPASPAGSYAVTGSGLAAANYTFAQSPFNATALTLVTGSTAPTPPTPATGPVGTVEPVTPERIATSAVLPTQISTAVWAGRALDVTQGMRFDGAGGTTFTAIDLGVLPQDAVAALLEARNRYKKSVFDTARRRLEADPALADAPACQTVREIEAGKCLVTDELLAQLQTDTTGATVAALATPVIAPSPSPSPSPSPPPSPPSPPPTAPVAVTAPGPANASPFPGALPPAGAASPGMPPVAPAGTAAAAPPASNAVTSTAPAPASAAATARINAARPVAAPTATAPALPASRPVRSASLPQIQRKLAVLIGDDNYSDERIPALDNAGRDALAVAAVLSSKLGYDTVVIRDASRDAIIGTLNKLAVQARPTDSIMIYYAGHGLLVDKTNLGYWIPSSANAERPETWVSNNDIDKLIGRIRASQVVLISDSCFSGSLVSDQRVLKSGEASLDASAILNRRAAVVMSSGGNEPVADGERDGHSPFAFSLMRNLSDVPTWRIGSDVFENVRSDVSKRLPQRPQYGTVRLGRHSPGADYLFESRQLDVPVR